MLSFNNNYILLSFIMMYLYATAFSGSMATASPICILIGLMEKLADTQSCYFGLRIAGCQL